MQPIVTPTHYFKDWRQERTYHPVLSSRPTQALSLIQHIRPLDNHKELRGIADELRPVDDRWELSDFVEIGSGDQTAWQQEGEGAMRRVTVSTQGRPRIGVYETSVVEHWRREILCVYEIEAAREPAELGLESWARLRAINREVGGKPHDMRVHFYHDGFEIVSRARHPVQGHNLVLHGKFYEVGEDPIEARCLRDLP